MISQDRAAMPLMDHLRELRRRLIYIVAALVVGMVLSLPATIRVMRGLQDVCPLCQLQAIHPTETIVTYFRVSLVLGMVFAMPVILYHAVAFVSPGLLPAERRLLYLMLPGAAVLFALGLAFGYFLAVPRAVAFLSQFLGDVAAAQWTLSNYVAFVMNLLLIIGLTFETPLVVFVLAKLNIVTPAFLGHYRRHAIVIMAVVAAVLTPTPDPYTMLLVLAPMIVLFELGVLLARIAKAGR
ncbi:MAG: twin-arginine translocase subunit TatC [Anaerolineae bacterium]